MPIHLFASFVQDKNRLQYIPAFENRIQQSVIVVDLETLEQFTTYMHQNHVIAILDQSLNPNALNPNENIFSKIVPPSLPIHQTDSNPFNYYIMRLEQFKKWYETTEQTVCVVGGRQLSNYFLTHFKPDQLFLTEYKREPSKSFPEVLELVKPDEYYVLNSFSEWSETTDYPELGRDVYYRYLNYSRTDTNSCEHQYLELCRKVLNIGNQRMDRTGTGTLSVFGTQMRFDLTRGLPLLTTKRVAWKSCIEELLWFLRGDTDARILQKKGVKIWDGNSTRDFLDRRGLTHYEDGVLGPIYGWQWRFFGSTYYPIHSDTSKSKPTDGFDQIEELIKGIRTDPFGRRHVVSAWNPKDLSNMALPPCHYTFQFYVEQEPDSPQKYLSCHFVMRSNDLGCGTSFNLLSYAVLTHLIALKVGMIPKELVYTCSDTHIYLNHIDALRTQLERKPVAAPRLWIRPEVATKDWNQIELSDFEMIGYFPDTTLKLEMAI